MNDLNPSTGRRVRRRQAVRAFTLLELIIVVGVIIVLLGLTLGVGSMVAAQSENRQLRATMTIVDAALAEFEAQTGRKIVFQGNSGTGSRYEHCGHASYQYDGVGNIGFYYDVPVRPFQDDRFSLDIEEGGFGWDEVTTCRPWRDGDFSDRPRQWMAATLSVLAQNPSCASIVAKADSNLVHNVECIIGSGGGSTPQVRALNIKEFIDPWLNQIYIVYPGRDFVADDATSTAGHNLGELVVGVRDDDGSIRNEWECRYGICRNGRPLLVSAGPDGLIGDLTADPSNIEFKRALDNVYSYEPAQP